MQFIAVKGAPDVVVERSTQALWHGSVVPIDQVRDEILAANRQLSERGCASSPSLPGSSTGPFAPSSLRQPTKQITACAGS